MTEPLSTFIPDTQAFLSELAANNTREWFKSRKDNYDTRLKHPAMRLLDDIANARPGVGTANLQPKLFRPHRDVRFSSDKTPYHTHLHLLWSIRSTGRQQPGLFFGISPGYVRAGGGLMGFDKAVLEDWRQAVDGPYGDDMSKTLSDLETQGFSADGPDLKRVPAPYDRDHPHEDLLRRKSMTVWTDLASECHDRPFEALVDCFSRLKPLLERLQIIL